MGIWLRFSVLTYYLRRRCRGRPHPRTVPKHIQFYWLSQSFFCGIHITGIQKAYGIEKKNIYTPRLCELWRLNSVCDTNHLYHLSIGLLTSLPNSILGHSKPTQTVCESFRQNHHKFGSKICGSNHRGAKLAYESTIKSPFKLAIFKWFMMIMIYVFLGVSEYCKGPRCHGSQSPWFIKIWWMVNIIHPLLIVVNG